VAQAKSLFQDALASDAVPRFDCGLQILRLAQDLASKKQRLDGAGSPMAELTQIVVLLLYG